MFDIGFWELLVIAVVLLLVLGPERLPEVAKQAAFFVRKARQGMFRIRNEMRSELGDDPFQGLQDARREVSNFKNDMKQFGRDLADSHEGDKKASPDADAMSESQAMSEDAALATPTSKKVAAVSTTAAKKKAIKKKAIKKKTSSKKATKKKITKKTSSKKSTSKKASTKKASKKTT